MMVALFAGILLLIDLLRLGKASDQLLRHLQKAVSPGKFSTLTLAKFAEKNELLGNGNYDWDYLPIRFGEDRTTIQDPEGALMFGSKKDVIKFKSKRIYKKFE